jgi:GNAT superfamily N-acetyltransferase
MATAVPITFRETVRATDPAVIRTIISPTGFFSDAEVDIAVELAGERLARGAASGYHFVFADRGRDTIGYTCYGPIPCTVRSFDMYWIAVTPAEHGRGVGTMLIEYTEARVRAVGGRILFIETSGRELYVPTHRFYERCGFTLDVRVQDFYAPGDDKLVFSKRY